MTRSQEARATEKSQHLGGPVDIEWWFDNHPPEVAAVGAVLDRITAAMKTATLELWEACPPSPERDQVMLKMQEASMWAKASVARYQRYWADSARSSMSAPVLTDDERAWVHDPAAGAVNLDGLDSIRRSPDLR